MFVINRGKWDLKISGKEEYVWSLYYKYFILKYVMLFLLKYRTAGAKELERVPGI